MALAQVGPFTAAFEAVATAVGAGIVLGGFVAGAHGLVVPGRRRPDRDVVVLNAGYGGGAVAVLAIAADLIVRYFV